MKLLDLDLWIASGNLHKAEEMKHFITKLLSDDINVKHQAPISAVESEPTFAGNAKIKSQALAKQLLDRGVSNFSVLADDSGLCVDLLEGQPGVLSARYSGPDASSKENLQKLLIELGKVSEELTKRTARFFCALNLIVVSEGEVTLDYLACGSKPGLIALEESGTGGFGYDAVFLDPITLKSYAECKHEDKQADSHRFHAFQALRSELIKNNMI